MFVFYLKENIVGEENDDETSCSHYKPRAALNIFNHIHSQLLEVTTKTKNTSSKTKVISF